MDGSQHPTAPTEETRDRAKRNVGSAPVSEAEQAARAAIGRNLDGILKQRRITRYQLELMSGVNHSSIMAIIAGNRDVKLSTLCVLSEALRVDVAGFLGDQPPKFLAPFTIDDIVTVPAKQYRYGNVRGRPNGNKLPVSDFKPNDPRIKQRLIVGKLAGDKCNRRRGTKVRCKGHMERFRSGHRCDTCDYVDRFARRPRPAADDLSDLAPSFGKRRKDASRGRLPRGLLAGEVCNRDGCGSTLVAFTEGVGCLRCGYRNKDARKIGTAPGCACNRSGCGGVIVRRGELGSEWLTCVVCKWIDDA